MCLFNINSRIARKLPDLDIEIKLDVL
jgi:hypothetical protein